MLDIVTADRAVSDPFDTNALLFTPLGVANRACLRAANFGYLLQPFACTGQNLTTDEPDLATLFYLRWHTRLRRKRHLNWTVVSYEGRIFWHATRTRPSAMMTTTFFLNTLVTNGFPIWGHGNKSAAGQTRISARRDD